MLGAGKHEVFDQVRKSVLALGIVRAADAIANDDRNVVERGIGRESHTHAVRQSVLLDGERNGRLGARGG
jgi:hypothetical protein